MSKFDLPFGLFSGLRFSRTSIIKLDSYLELNASFATFLLLSLAYNGVYSSIAIRPRKRPTTGAAETARPR